MTDVSWTVGEPITVDAEHVRTFAAAVGETGSDVPPTYPVTLTWSVQSAALDDFFALPGLGLHGEHTLDFHRPVRFREVLLPRAAVVAVAPRRTGSTVTCRTELRAIDGDLVCTQLFTVFQVGRILPPVGSVPRLDGDPGTPTATTEVGARTEVVEADQSRRYAAASGDDYRIHTDPDFARAEGLPDVILHGMCTLAFAARAVVQLAAAGDSGRLRFLAVRFSAPVPLGSRLTTTVGAGYVGTFGTELADGTAVLTRGRYALR